MSADTSTIAAGSAKRPGAAGRRARSPVDLALADLREGLRRWELWGTLGWNDIRQRYRRSTIGPFWITLSMGILIGGLSILWSTLFRHSIPNYLPFFALGYITWTLINTLVMDSCTALYESEGIIKQIPAPLSIHVYRIVWRALIITAHNLCNYIVIMLALRIWPGFGFVVAALGFALIALNGIAVGLIVSLLSARFRDIPPFLANLMQMLFFFSPILWMPDSLPLDARLLVTLNPVYYFLEIVRQPLQGVMPEAWIWLTALAITAANGALALLLFARLRARVAYWI